MIVHQTMPSLVSVIIPAFNAEKYIGEAIESALNQSYPQLEIIVVNDGSTDNTVKVVNGFIAKESKIRLLGQKRSGVAAARNMGIRHSHGEFIAPMDADDIWHPDKIYSQIELMRKNGPDVGLVYVWNTLLDEASNHIGLLTSFRFEGNVFIELLITHFVGCSSTPLIRRECIEKVGGYDTRFFTHRAQGCEDWDLHLRISEHYKFVVVKRLLVGYRQPPNSMSRDHRQMKRSRDLMFNFFRSRHQEIPNRLLAWSNSFYHLYLQNMSAKEGDYLHSLIYLLRAAWELPALVLCGDYRRYYTILAIQIVKHWMPPSLWARLRLRKHPEKVPAKKSLADLQQQAERVPRLKQRSISYLKNRLIEISRKKLAQDFAASAPRRSYWKDAHDE